MPIILNTDKEYYLKLKDGLSNYENYIENIDFSEILLIV